MQILFLSLSECLNFCILYFYQVATVPVYFSHDLINCSKNICKFTERLVHK
jgi:hypothetical protein